MMNKWVAEFVREIDMIDNFFVERLQGYVKNFVDLQSHFLGVDLE